MSGYVNQPDYWNPNDNPQGQNEYNFEMPTEDYEPQLNFQSFEGQQPSGADGAQQYYGGEQNLYATNPYLNPAGGGNLYVPGEQGGMFGGSSVGSPSSGPGEFDEEPPLLEELGINPEFIVQKTLTVLNPFRTPDLAAVQDTDFAGPLVFCLAFGGFLLLTGKVHFNYIYGFGALGCVVLWILLSLMSTDGVSFGTVVTIFGYCLLPMVLLSVVNVVLNLQGYAGFVLTAVSILWCSLSASKLFVTALLMEHQQPLVLYPCALFYGVFALITIF